MADEEETIVRDIRSITNPDGEGKPREEPYLIVLSGGPVGRMYRIRAEGPTIIGRAIDADVRLEDEGVSRNHARILYPNETGSPVVEDLNSTNGTFVNGEQIRRYELQDGDKVQIGSTSILCSPGRTLSCCHKRGCRNSPEIFLAYFCGFGSLGS